MKIPSNGGAIMLKKSLQLKCDIFIMTTLSFDDIFVWQSFLGMVLKYYTIAIREGFFIPLHCAESSTYLLDGNVTLAIWLYFHAIRLYFHAIFLCSAGPKGQSSVAGVVSYRQLPQYWPQCSNLHCYDGLNGDQLRQ